MPEKGATSPTFTGSWAAAGTARVITAAARAILSFVIGSSFSADSMRTKKGRSSRRRKEAAMKPFTFLAVVVFSLVALFQLARFFLAWPVTINGVEIPVWVSAVMAAFAALMAVMVAREARARSYA